MADKPRRGVSDAAPAAPDGRLSHLKLMGNPQHGIGVALRQQGRAPQLVRLFDAVVFSFDWSLAPDSARELARQLIEAAELADPAPHEVPIELAKRRKRWLTKAARIVDAVVSELDREHHTCTSCGIEVYRNIAQNRMAVELDAVARKLDRCAHSKHLKRPEDV